MVRLKLALMIGAVGLLIAILHFLATFFFLYWDIPWFDILMHLLGGFWVGLLGLWILSFFSKTSSFKLSYVFLASVLFAFIVGVLWEIFEFGAGISQLENNFWQDTLTDILMDIVGGVLAGLYANKRYVNLVEEDKGAEDLSRTKS